MEHAPHDADSKADAAAPVSIVSYMPWASTNFNGARVTMITPPLTDEGEISIAAAHVADVQRQPNGEIDLLIVCRAGDDAAAKEPEIREQLCAAVRALADAPVGATTPAFNVARWLAEFTQQGGWWSAMSDGRVGIGISECHFTEEQMAKARRMVGALSKRERETVEAEVRRRAGYQLAGRA